MNVYQRIKAVMEDLPYVQKKKDMNLGGKSVKTLAYEDLAADVQPLLIKHGMVLLSSLQDLKVETLESEKPGYNSGDPPKKIVTTIATVQIAFTLVNADQPDDRTPPMCFPGMGFDTSDKAVGKATTYAAKDFLRKVFVVPSGEEPEDDNNDRPPARPSAASQPKTGTKPQLASAAAPKGSQEAKDGAELLALIEGAKDKVGKEAVGAILTTNGFRNSIGPPNFGMSDEGAAIVVRKLRELLEAKK